MSYPPQPVGYGAPGMVPADYGFNLNVPRSRPLWKTWLFSVLLTLVPFVGSTMAVIYVYTREQPDGFHGGAAFLASVIYFLNLVVAVAIGAGIFALVSSM